MPASLNCPTCGAPAGGPDATRCDYCGSTLTVVACPSCFGVMFAGMQFCPNCGAKAERTVDDSATLPCPSCRASGGTMRSVAVGATQFYECSTCAGTWVAADTFTQLCLSREQRGAIAGMVGSGGGGGGGAKRLAANDAVRYVQCPLCTKLMNRENFGRRSGVIIDVCKGHGAWFGAGELQSVMTFINSGGLERARVLEAEQRRADAEVAALRREGAVGRGAPQHIDLTHVATGALNSGDAGLIEALRALLN